MDFVHPTKWRKQSFSIFDYAIFFFFLYVMLLQTENIHQMWEGSDANLQNCYEIPNYVVMLGSLNHILNCSNWL
jgi:hypothetical protein